MMRAIPRPRLHQHRRRAAGARGYAAV